MLGLVDNLARRIVRRGFRRGLIEGSSIWLVAGALAWLVRIVVRPEAPKVTREDLRVGESIIVTHLPAPQRQSRRQRRRVRDGARTSVTDSSGTGA